MYTAILDEFTGISLRLQPPVRPIPTIMLRRTVRGLLTLGNTLWTSLRSHLRDLPINQTYFTVSSESLPKSTRPLFIPINWT